MACACAGRCREERSESAELQRSQEGFGFGEVSSRPLLAQVDENAHYKSALPISLLRPAH